MCQHGLVRGKSYETKEKGILPLYSPFNRRKGENLPKCLVKRKERLIFAPVKQNRVP